MINEKVHHNSILLKGPWIALSMAISHSSEDYLRITDKHSF